MPLPDQTTGEETQKIVAQGGGPSIKHPQELYLTCPRCGKECALTDTVCPMCGANFDDLLESEADDRTYVIASEVFPSSDSAHAAARIGAIPVKSVTVLLDLEDGQYVTLPQADVVIVGRGSSSDPESRVDLSPYGAHEKGVSRRHIKIMRKNTLIYVADLASDNGTLLNGRRLMPNIERLLRAGDELQLGHLTFHVKYV